MATQKDCRTTLYLCIINQKGSMGEWLKPAHC